MLKKTIVLTVNPIQRNVKGIRKSLLQEKDYNFQEIFKPGLKEQTTSTKRLTLNLRVNHSIYVQIFHCTQLSLFCKNSFTLNLFWDTKIKQNLNVENAKKKKKLWIKIPAAEHLITTENKEWQDCHDKYQQLSNHYKCQLQADTSHYLQVLHPM